MSWNFLTDWYPKLFPILLTVKLLGKIRFGAKEQHLENRLNLNKKLLLIYLHKHSKMLANTLFSLTKLNRKKNPKMMLPTLKKKSPFFLGNLVTKRSEISKKSTEREVGEGFDASSQQYVDSKIGSYLLQWKLHTVVVHVGSDFYNSNKSDYFHVFCRLKYVKHWLVLFVCIVNPIMLYLLLNEVVGLFH